MSTCNTCCPDIASSCVTVRIDPNPKLDCNPCARSKYYAPEGEALACFTPVMFDPATPGVVVKWDGSRAPAGIVASSRGRVVIIQRTGSAPWSAVAAALGMSEADTGSAAIWWENHVALGEAGIEVYLEGGAA